MCFHMRWNIFTKRVLCMKRSRVRVYYVCAKVFTRTSSVWHSMAAKEWRASLHNTPKNTIEFRVWGRFAMFTDPLTRVGGEKCSYHLPTYEALKGIAKSIYWKPTFIWHIDCVRVMKRIRTQTKGMKPLDYGGGNTLAIYTYLTGDPDSETIEQRVEYQVRAHFEWNEHRPE